MRAKDIILEKKRGESLDAEKIRFMVNGYTKGDIPDYQMSAFAMAVCFRGMDETESAALCEAMTYSGDVLDLSELGNLSADKHSTGGVGDKTTLVAAPVAASLGCFVAKMSGRGLGHTGGTLDKLESVRGFRTSLATDEFLSQVKRCGVAVIGQSLDLAPADKKLYALRDATSTVDSIPLIASSIMSKKLAAGARSIVLDVKTGSGAFMKNISDARALAELMISIGKSFGRNVRALITNMDVPLGRAVGNSLEVIEAVSVLKGETKGELRRVCLSLAAHMVSMAKGIPFEEAYRLAGSAVDSGAAFEKMKEWIGAQGGDVRMLDDVSLFPSAPVRRTLTSPRSGYISAMDTEKIGIAASHLGAGRLKKDDEIDRAAGIIISAKTGDYVSKGDVLAVLHTSSEALAENAEREYLSAIDFSDEKTVLPPLILSTVG